MKHLPSRAHKSVNALPTELLSNVFLLLMWSQNSSSYYSTSWVAVIAVCRRWRDTAHATASLWTMINPTHPQWMKLSLSRSQSSPLRLISKDTEVDLASLALALRECERFSSVRVPFDPDWNNNIDLAPLRPQTLPFLTTVAFSLPRFKSPGPAPRIFDQCHLPRLRSLSLIGFMPNPPSPLLSSTLTTLSVAPRTLPITIPKILEVISKTPNLQTLDLRSNVLEPPPEPCLSPVHAKHMTHLPHLKFLYLGFPSELMGTVTLLNQITFPSQATLAVVAGFGGQDLSTETFCRGLSPTLLGENRTGPPPIYRTGILDFFASRPTLYLWQDTHPTKHDSTTNPRAFFIKSPDPNDIGSHPEKGFSIWASSSWRRWGNPANSFSFSEAVRRCPLGNLESVFITDALNDTLYRSEIVDWHLICRRMPNIVRMQITAGDKESPERPRLNQNSHDMAEMFKFYRNFLHRVLLLSYGPSNADGSGGEEGESGSSSSPSAQQIQQTPPLPRLRTLVVRGVTLRNHWMKALLEVLEERKDIGVPIERLVLEDCKNVLGGSVEKLQKFVGEVSVVQ